MGKDTVDEPHGPDSVSRSAVEKYWLFVLFGPVKNISNVPEYLVRDGFRSAKRNVVELKTYPKVTTGPVLSTLSGLAQCRETSLFG